MENKQKLFFVNKKVRGENLLIQETDLVDNFLRQQANFRSWKTLKGHEIL